MAPGLRLLSGSAGSGSGITQLTDIPDLGPSYDLNVSGARNVRVNATASQNCSLTISGQTASTWTEGALYVTATGGTRTITLPSAQTVVIGSGTSKIITFFSPDGSTEVYFEQGGTTGGAAASTAANWKPTAALIEAASRIGLALSNATAHATGVLRLYAIPQKLQAGVTYSGARLWSGTTPFGTPTNQWACLVDKTALTVLAAGTDKTSTAWAANSSSDFAWTPYTPASDTEAYLGVMLAGTTMPSMWCLPSWGTTNNVAGIRDAPLVVADSTTGLTTPLAATTVVTAALASGGVARIPYFYII